MKKRRRSLFLISIVFILLLSVVYILRNKGYDNVTLYLESLKSNNEYQFDDIKWQSTVQEVSEKLPYSLERDTALEGVPSHVTYYKSKNKYVLDGQSAYASFEFGTSRLKTVKFSFHLGDNYSEWFENQVEKLQQLYGEPSDKKETSSEEMQLKSFLYKWETDTTTLQLIMMTGEKITPSAIIGIGIK